VGNLNFTKMPTLDGEAKTLYVAMYGEDAYNEFTDDDADPKYHGGLLLVTPSAAGPVKSKVKEVLHQPRHDVESIFWTLFSSIICAHPSAAHLEPTTDDDFASAVDALNKHTMGKRGFDNRGNVLGWPAYRFQLALHPELATLAPMLHSMAQQILPEYSFLSPEPRREHRHEAMRRILLQQIVNMGENAIPLDPEKIRVPMTEGKVDEKYRGSRGSRGTKWFFSTPDIEFPRPVVAEDDVDARKSKRSRSKGVHAYRCHYLFCSFDVSFMLTITLSSRINLTNQQMIPCALFFIGMPNPCYRLTVHREP
jgi:hypothetical protein